MSIAARALVSESEFIALPESNQRIELIDGEVIVAPSPGFWHQEVLTRIVSALRDWAQAQRSDVTVVQAPLDVRFAPNRILQPDAMVFRQVLPADLDVPVGHVPELCIEVLSSNRAYDRITKRYVYAEAGVQEYWIVDPAGTVERRTGPSLAEVAVHEEHLTSDLLPGFSLDLAQVFARR
jgi:Uma2 family endonuclease